VWTNVWNGGCVDIYEQLLLIFLFSFTLFSIYWMLWWCCDDVCCKNNRCVKNITSTLPFWVKNNGIPCDFFLKIFKKFLCYWKISKSYGHWNFQLVAGFGLWIKAKSHWKTWGGTYWCCIPTGWIVSIGAEVFLKVKRGITFSGKLRHPHISPGYLCSIPRAAMLALPPGVEWQWAPDWCWCKGWKEGQPMAPTCDPILVFFWRSLECLCVNLGHVEVRKGYFY